MQTLLEWVMVQWQHTLTDRYIKDNPGRSTNFSETATSVLKNNMSSQNSIELSTKKLDRAKNFRTSIKTAINSSRKTASDNFENQQEVPLNLNIENFKELFANEIKDTDELCDEYDKKGGTYNGLLRTGTRLLEAVQDLSDKLKLIDVNFADEPLEEAIKHPLDYLIAVLSKFYFRIVMDKELSAASSAFLDAHVPAYPGETRKALIRFLQERFASFMEKYEFYQANPRVLKEFIGCTLYEVNEINPESTEKFREELKLFKDFLEQHDDVLLDQKKEFLSHFESYQAAFETVCGKQFFIQEEDNSSDSDDDNNNKKGNSSGWGLW